MLIERERRNYLENDTFCLKTNIARADYKNNTSILMKTFFMIFTNFIFYSVIFLSFSY